MQKPFIVGITGGSASGKTTFLKKLIESFPSDEICLISQDNYYLPREQQQVDEQGFINFDEPESLDLAAFAQDIEKIKKGEAFQRSEYTFNKPDVVPQLLTFEPKPIVVVEGLFVFYYKAIADQLDLKLFINARRKLRLKRRLHRDSNERGYSEDEETIYRWKHHVEPAYERYIRPYRRTCDLVVPNNVHFERGLDVVVAYLRKQMNA
jgi:uridine kinase